MLRQVFNTNRTIRTKRAITYLIRVKMDENTLNKLNNERTIILFN